MTYATRWGEPVVALLMLGSLVSVCAGSAEATVSRKQQRAGRIGLIGCAAQLHAS